jgi:hypothetical protein
MALFDLYQGSPSVELFSANGQGSNKLEWKSTGSVKKQFEKGVKGTCMRDEV